jgi:transcriptional regulator with XRE-family HTH domain
MKNSSLNPQGLIINVIYTIARKKFGLRVRYFRQLHNLTQENLAEAVNRSVEYVSLLERGERSPSFETIVDLAKALQILPELLMADENERLQPGSDIERLSAALGDLKDLQQLAHEYGISDIFQDNGGKVLQVLIMLGLRSLPGREGNDAVDSEGNEYELKTVNRALNRNAGITTHHHLNKIILGKYGTVKAWIVAFYEGIELKEIYTVSPLILEPLFQQWEQKIDLTGALNNPKIPVKLVKQGTLIYKAP